MYEVWVILSIQIIGIGKRVIDWSKVEVVNIIDLITTILGKRAPNFEIYSKMVNITINFT